MAAKIQNMTEGKPVRLIIAFALPLMLGNIFQQLYTMVDTIIVGRALGVSALAAVGASDGLNWWKNSPDHNARLLTRISNKIAIGTCDGLWAAIVYND